MTKLSNDVVDVRLRGIRELREEFDKWLYIEDQEYLSVLLAVKVSHFMPGDPVWMFIIGPSGDTKTEMLRSMVDENTKETQTLTSHTIVSGYNPRDTDRSRYDLAPKLHEKIWLIYDFSEMLAKKQDERNEIFSQLRSLYDGVVSKDFGTGLQVVYGSGRGGIDRLHTTLMAACTPQIDNYLLEQQLLGTRHLSYRVNTRDNERIMDKCEKNMEFVDEMRKKLRLATQEYIKTIQIKEIELSEEEKRKLKALSNLLVLLRAGVRVNRYTDEVEDISWPEKPSRVHKMIVKLYKALLHIADIKPEDAMRVINNVVFSSVPEKRVLILKVIENYRDEPPSTNKIAETLRLGYKTVTRELNALHHLKVVNKFLIEDERQHIPLNHWSINTEKLKQLSTLPHTEESPKQLGSSMC